MSATTSQRDKVVNIIKFITTNADKARHTINRQTTLVKQSKELQKMLKENNIRTDDFDSYEESTIEPSGFFTDGRRTTIRKILEKDGDSDGENK